MKEQLIQDFLNNEYSNTALYNCYRMIASVVDGLKPSARKVVYTIKKRKINEMKVGRLAPAVAEDTEYLHGEGSLLGVIVNMTQDFVGSNNLPLLSPNGNFGSRHLPSASAPRYIFSKRNKNFDEIFMSEDDPILIEQEFDGQKIEPKFFVPILPMLLVNGSEGMGTGYAQKILPRNPIELKEAIIEIERTGDTKKSLVPYYINYKGSIQPRASDGSWEITGTFSIDNTTSITITELPIGYTLSSYLKVLERLQEDNVIKSYEDLSENDEFLFKLDVPRVFTKLSKEEILDKLKLIKRVTENYTCIDENNTVKEFTSAKEILKYYCKIREEFYEKRRLYQIAQLQEEISYLESMMAFIQSIFDKKVNINNQPKKKIEEQLVEINKKKEIFLKKDNSFDYLLRMPIYSFTAEKVKDLQKQIQEKSKKKNYLLKETSSSLWKADVESYFGTN